MAKFTSPPTSAGKPNILDQPAQPLERTRTAWYSVVQRRLNAVGLSPNTARGNQLQPPLKTERDKVLEALPKNATALQQLQALAARDAVLRAQANTNPPQPVEQPAGEVVMTALWDADP